MLYAIKARRSYRNFDNKAIEEEKLNEILKAAMFAPSGKNLKPYDLIVIKDKNIKISICEDAELQPFIKEASVLIIVVGNPNVSSLWLEDCSVLSENIYLEATNQGLGACWVNIKDGLTADGRSREALVRDLLEIPKDRRVLCIMAVGYPIAIIGSHNEDEVDYSKIHKDKW